jgi:hypothetical protein
MVEVTPPSVCQSTKAQDHNSSRSNNTSSIVLSPGEEDSSGLNENNSGETIVFPNPSKGVFNVRLSDMDETTVANVYDINGKLVKSLVVTVSEFLIDMTQFENGVYILETKSEHYINKTQIIKQ